MTFTMPTPRRWTALRPWRRHSLVLTLGGFIYLSVGMVYLGTDAPPSRNRSLELALNVAPLQVWGLVWIAAGIAGLISARWPPASEKWGYTVMSSLAALWGSGYALGVLFLDTPDQALSGGAVWTLVAVLWWGISGLENPGRVMREG
ncbi:hypothetical protein QWY28_13185 [Nocardioides sp. SOB77]|uniref:Uncharacterized protein n=1 Tax=Nocardioides oceani TaxID=3058369 RepID=A0ABT8FGW0_9ACTN|nr:hypothetical protein [Nocardioides oceani]MDN4173908.1 hypothetical protein [Nocardioides oceani]